MFMEPKRVKMNRPGISLASGHIACLVAVTLVASAFFYSQDAESVATESTTECIDTTVHCISWRAAGYCATESYKVFMLHSCCAACRRGEIIPHEVTPNCGEVFMP